MLPSDRNCAQHVRNLDPGKHLATAQLTSQAPSFPLSHGVGSKSLSKSGSKIGSSRQIAALRRS